MRVMILSAQLRRRFREHLLRWYDREKRRLPWRGETDPYRILVSEIMLQQTRVAVVEGRYRKFLRQFPSVRKLAQASQDAVLAAWSGLGYYRRARNLHAAAKEVARNGGFPGSAAELMELPGIGRYTAAAVASIAFGQPEAVVDGNVKRVLQRLTGRNLSDREFWEAAQGLLEPRRPGDFNQAMMDLGAVICLPGQPLCNKCPVIRLCSSRGAASHKERAPRKKAVLSYLLTQKEGQIFLQQRHSSLSLMPGMWELPLLKNAVKIKRKPLLKLRHSITVTDYTAMVFASSAKSSVDGRWVDLDKLERLPLTGLT